MNGIVSQMPRRRVVLLLVVALGVMVLGAAILHWLQPGATPSEETPLKKEIRAFLGDKEQWLEQAVEDIGDRFIMRESADTDAIRAIFTSPSLYFVGGDNPSGSIIFYFHGGDLGDTKIYLHYSPDDNHALDNFVSDANEWHLVSSTEKAWRWEGGGIFGRGYIDVERLRPNWFYAEIYYPT